MAAAMGKDVTVVALEDHSQFARKTKHEQGLLIKGNARHPIVEDDVVIYAGATILGRITIGKGAIIGGNVWLTQSVPPGNNVIQAQMRHTNTLMIEPKR